MATALLVSNVGVHSLIRPDSIFILNPCVFVFFSQDKFQMMLLGLSCDTSISTITASMVLFQKLSSRKKISQTSILQTILYPEQFLRIMAVLLLCGIYGWMEMSLLVSGMVLPYKRTCLTLHLPNLSLSHSNTRYHSKYNQWRSSQYYWITT